MVRKLAVSRLVRGKVAQAVPFRGGFAVVAGVGWLSVEPVPLIMGLLPDELEVPGSFRLMGGDLLSSRLPAAFQGTCLGAIQPGGGNSGLLPAAGGGGGGAPDSSISGANCSSLIML